MTIKQQGGVFGRNPTFNEASVAALLVNNFSGLSSGSVAGFNGHVEIGTGKQLRWGDGDSKITGYSSSLFYIDSNNTRFRSGDGSTEFARFTSDGLLFNGDTAAANALDDYEEGTFTPVVADAASGGNAAAGGTFTGHYTKIGRQVTAFIELTNVNTTGMIGTNDLYVTGLPFVSASLAGTIRFSGSMFASLTSINASTPYLVPDIIENESYLRIIEWGDSAGTDFVRVDALTSGTSDVYISITYIAG